MITADLQKSANLHLLSTKKEIERQETNLCVDGPKKNINEKNTKNTHTQIYIYIYIYIYPRVIDFKASF